jgi:[ribosomal protein S5]-alanine N-acetyltransferase
MSDEPPNIPAEVFLVRPTLTTARLVLRPHELADAPRVQRLAGDWKVADTLLTMPHPYLDGVAETWIAGRAKAWTEQHLLDLAIALPGTGLIGGIGLVDYSPRHRHAELGYWIGLEFWGRGYCTEAAEAVIRFGFERMNLVRIFARHFARNPASGHVMRKLGMTHEGCLRQHFERWGGFEDAVCYGLLRDEWAARRQS